MTTDGPVASQRTGVSEADGRDRQRLTFYPEGVGFANAFTVL